LWHEVLVALLLCNYFIAFITLLRPHKHEPQITGFSAILALRIERIKFQSSVACWGYFSIGAKGGIHEYADSQFGHIFAHGNNREEARKALMLSLKNIEVVGEIRNPVESLGKVCLILFEGIDCSVKLFSFPRAHTHTHPRL